MCNTIPRLKLPQFAANSVNINIMPANFEVAVNRARDVIVEVVQSLKQVQFILYLLQLRIFGHRQSK